jgi:tetratricopeptide (TPR) repeat protein
MSRRLIAIVILAAGLLALLAVRGIANPAPTAYESDLAEVDARLVRNARARAATPHDPAAALEEVHQRYLRASLTADFDDFRRAEQAIERVLAELGPTHELLLARANLAFKLHRIAAAKRDVAALPETAATQGLAADIALMEGRYADASRDYDRLLLESPTWDNLARIAYLQSKTGDVAGADRLYVKAEEELTAKELRSYAWVELQRGLMRYENGAFENALQHYRRADRAYSGYWLVEEHLAETLQALGRTREAVALYRSVIARTHNPEYIGALAVILRKDDPAEARALDRDADRLYAERYRLYPEAAAGHMIRFLLARPEPSPQLLALARENVQLRPNGEAKLLLAEAYLKTGARAPARAAFAEVLQTPWRTPEVTRVQRQMAVPPAPP